MAKPTYEDARILLQLAEMWPGCALDWVWSDEFIPDYKELVEKHGPPSEEWGRIRLVCGYFETIGTLYKYGLINEDLLFDWAAVAPIWDRVKGFTLGWREEMGMAALYENFEAMAEANRRWLRERGGEG